MVKIVLEEVPIGFLAVEGEGVLAFVSKSGIVAPEVPVTASNGALLFFLTATHAALDLQTVVDAGSVGDDERRTGISLRFTDGLQALSLVSAHGNLSDIDVTVSGLHETEVFLGDTLAGSSKLSNGTHGSGFGSLTAGVGIYLRVKHEDVHVFTACEHVVESTVTNVVGSTVTADNPLASFGEIVAEFKELLSEFVTLGSTSLEYGFHLVSHFTSDGGVVLVVNPTLSEFFHFCARAFAHEDFAKQRLDAGTHLLVCHHHAQTELTEVFEEGVCPSGTLTLLVLAVGRGRNGTGIDGGATGGVGNHLTVTEELRNEFDVRSLTATGASAGELKERSSELRVLGIEFDVHKVLLALDVLDAVVPVGSLAHLSFEGHHFKSLNTLETRADVSTVAATEAVEDIDLLNEVHALHGSGCLHLDGFALIALEFFFVEHERTDGSVRTNESTLVALDAVLFLPNRHEGSDATLLVGCCSLFPCSILGNLEGTDGKKVTVLSVDGTNELGDVGGLIAFHLGISGQGSPSGVNGELLVFAATIHSLIVLINHILSLLAVGLHDELLHLFHCKVHGDDFGDAEESRLENGVGAVAETNFLRNLGGVNIVNGNIMLGKVALHIVRQVGCEFFAFPDGVEKEGAVVAQTAKHVVHVEVSLHVACHEVRGLDLIGGADGGVTKTQVRAGETAGLLGVVGEVCLAILVGVIADNLDGVLVGTDRTVCTKTVELSLKDAFATECFLFFQRQRSEGHIVHDAHSEVVLGFGQSEVVEDGDNHGRRGVGRTEAVASANDDGTFLLVVEGILHVKIERFAAGTGFLRAVEHGNLLAGLGHCGEEVLDREGTVEVNADHADLLALGVEIVNGFASSLGDRTHADDDTFCIVCTIVTEEFIFTTGDFGNGSHILLHDGGYGVIVGVANFAVCEEGFGILSHASGDRMFGREGTVAELADLVHGDERTKVFLVHHLNLLVFVRGAEAVEEVDEGHAAFKCGEVSDCREVHDFLHRSFAEHGEAGLTASHDILMVTEDAERVTGESTSRNVEHARQEFTCNLVHVRNHEQKTL